MQHRRLPKKGSFTPRTRPATITDTDITAMVKATAAGTTMKVTIADTTGADTAVIMAEDVAITHERLLVFN